VIQVLGRKHGGRFAGAFGLLLASVVFCAEVRAGCGPNHDRPVVALDLIFEAGSDPAAEGGLPAPDRGTPGPCPGGICAPGRPIPMAPTAPVPPRAEHWPSLAVEERPPVTISEGRPEEVAVRFEPPCAASLERPPRISRRARS
jgi:hypothetical protein